MKNLQLIIHILLLSMIGRLIVKNIIERHKLNSQRNIYLQKNPEDSNLSKNELCKTMKDNGLKLKN